MTSASAAAVPALEKVFHFDSPTEVYTADACVISCFDARFDTALRKFLKRRGILVYDHVKIPASVKPWAAPDGDPDTEILLRALRTSIRLHRPGKVLLIAHTDCGGYPNTPNDTVTRDLQRAGIFLRAAEPSLKVECYFADFDGIYRVG